MLVVIVLRVLYIILSNVNRLELVIMQKIVNPSLETFEGNLRPVQFVISDRRAVYIKRLFSLARSGFRFTRDAGPIYTG